MKAIEHMNITDALSDQIEALLDLMMCADSDCADVRSMSTAAEMTLNMFTELKAEMNKGFEELKEYELEEKENEK